MNDSSCFILFLSKYFLHLHLQQINDVMTGTTNIQEERKWFVAYVRMHHERKTAEKLSAMHIESFVPVREEIHQWSQRKKKVQCVLIPQMVFIHATEKERLEALTLSSISHYMVLRGEHRPAVIPDEQMKQFMFMVDYSEETIEMMDSQLIPGQNIKVIKGPLAGLEGELIEIGGKANVIVRLDLLGCAGVDMPVGYVKPIS